MEKLLDVLQLIYPFVRNPYAPHSFLRLDAFHKQFTIVCSGVMYLPLNDPGVGCRRGKTQYTLGYRSSIEDAIRLCTSKFHELYAYPQIKAGASFEPRRVEVYYTAAKAYQATAQASGQGPTCVLSGMVEEAEIIWCRPAAVVNEIFELEIWLDTFHRKVSEQAWAGELDIAQSVCREAAELKRFFDSLKWKNFVLRALDQTGVTCTPEEYPYSSGH